MSPEGRQTREHCFLAMFPEGGQTYSFLDMFAKGRQTGKHCFLAIVFHGGTFLSPEAKNYICQVVYRERSETYVSFGRIRLKGFSSNQTSLNFVHSSRTSGITKIKNVIKFIVPFSVFGCRKASGRIITPGDSFLLDICPVGYTATVEVANTWW